MKKKLFLTICVTLIVSLFYIVYLDAQDRSEESKKNRPNYDYEKVLVGDGILVLCYHRIISDSEITNMVSKLSSNSQIHEYNVFLDDFTEQMTFLKEKKIQILTADQLSEKLTSQSVTGKSVVITFDDVDTTLPSNAYPILKEKQIPFTQFIITGETDRLKDGSKMANWEQIEQMTEQQITTTGIHTHNLHYQEDFVPVLSTSLSKKTIKKDYEKSQKQMVKHTGKKADFFAYPYGADNKYLKKIMVDDGVKGIFTLEPGLVTDETDPGHIPRVIVTSENWPRIESWLLSND